ncbi:carbohydrate kinase family protein [Paenibacillus albiflavus]|uniref:carbohydrate kinase family protein n=1 Tax=Paenibacillus albiflavus TaxID=2545760 RepID=UPI00140460AD|nr:carbohydrate kinase family protein [Paenibacillus albiflavus]
MNQVKSRVACIGAVNLDRKASAKQPLIIHTSNPVSMSQSCGGVARNIGENLVRLGCEVTMLSCIGDDGEGRYIKEESIALGMQVDSIRTLEQARTGTYTALLDTNGEMFVAMAHMDINDLMTPEMVDEMWPAVATANAVLLDTNFPEACIEHIIARCHLEGISLYIDPVSTPKARKLPDFLFGVEVIMPNRDEAETMSGLRIDTIADCEEACARIRARGARNVIMTLGEQGIYCSTPDRDTHLPAMHVDVVDVTGAGDAFAAGLIYGVLQGKSLVDACRVGIAASALTLQTVFSVRPDLSINQLNKLIEEPVQ